MVQGRKVLAAMLGLHSERLRAPSAELASSTDLSEARVLVGLEVRGLLPWGALGLLQSDLPGSMTGVAAPCERVVLGLVAP
jgi:hypothetical protein